MPSSRFHGVFGPLLPSKKVGISTDEDESEVATEPVTQSMPTVGQLALDIYGENGYTIIKAPIAGVKLSDIDIDVADNVITIRGERQQCDEVTDEGYYLQECYWGTFERSVTLPHAIDPSKVKATFSKDNILKIYVPKEKKVKIVKISEGG